ncbi:MAG: YtxH domain-containing protein [Actinobacteria bacterium]|nr:YtxH domain-containing protein [Actinomycetota bacterium]
MCGDSSNGSSAFKYGMIGFIIGVAAGAITALFLTTKTGEELRADLKKAVLDIREKVEEKASKIKDLTKDKYSEIINNVVANYKKAKEFTQREIELIKKVLLEQKEI